MSPTSLRSSPSPWLPWSIPQNRHAIVYTIITTSEFTAPISEVHCSVVSSTSPSLSSVTGGDYASQVYVPWSWFPLQYLVWSTVLIFSLSQPVLLQILRGRAGPDNVVALGMTLHCPLPVLWEWSTGLISYQGSCIYRSGQAHYISLKYISAW